MSRFSFFLRQILNTMWFLPAAFSAGALVTIALALFIARWAPNELPWTISQEAVQSILEILATSLLTVSVFALSTLVSALASASSSTSPRAVSLIVADRAAQTSISVFIGAFLFSILAILGLSAGIYGSASRLLLFSVTLLVVAIVIAALIRWIAQISDIGRVSHTLERVESATEVALTRLREHPLFDCAALHDEPRGQPIHSGQLGYVQHFDVARLDKLAGEHNLRVAVLAMPGAYASPVRPLMMVEGELTEELVSDLSGAFVVGDTRTFENDPRFGLSVLAEIADKALSPAVNDAGTAIDVVGRITRLLSGWDPRQTSAAQYQHVMVRQLSASDLIEDAFRPIARDGAGTIEVVLRLLYSLEVISRSNPFFRQEAIDAARDAVSRSEKVLTAEADLEALRQASWFTQSGSPGRLSAQ
ncbi:DUF2254 domain-containing protein [Nostoc sp. 3335mG]|nr:DUF2254 domain-containing protein [Nostoc sp. 3335mG]